MLSNELLASDQQLVTSSSNVFEFQQQQTAAPVTTSNNFNNLVMVDQQQQHLYQQQQQQQLLNDYTSCVNEMNNSILQNVQNELSNETTYLNQELQQQHTIVPQLRSTPLNMNDIGNATNLSSNNTNSNYNQLLINNSVSTTPINAVPHLHQQQTIHLIPSQSDLNSLLLQQQQNGIKQQQQQQATSSRTQSPILTNSGAMANVLAAAAAAGGETDALSSSSSCLSSSNELTSKLEKRHAQKIDISLALDEKLAIYRLSLTITFEDRTARLIQSMLQKTDTVANLAEELIFHGLVNELDKDTLCNTLNQALNRPELIETENFISTQNSILSK